jgi:predicted PurR-regulated permease PerM
MPQTSSTFYPRVFASVTAVVLGFAVIRILQPFVAPLLWAALLAFLLLPANERLRAAFRGRKTAAALLLTVAAVLMVVVPAVFLGVMFGKQASDLVGQLQATAAQHQIQGPGDILELVDRVARRVGLWLPIPADRIRDSLVSAGEQVIQSVLSMGGSLFTSVLEIILAIVLALFLFFFFLRDGEQMVTRAMVLVPLDDRRKAQMLSHLANIIRAVVLGSLVTAVVQGTLAGIGFALAGLPTPIVFAVLSTGASVIPLIGTSIVWIPAALYLGLTGHWGAALFLMIWGVAVVSSADNVVRPLFVSSRTRMTTLPVFIGLLGGVSAFGAIGIFLGPVVIALVLALFEFAEEALAEQKSAGRQTSGPAAPA